MYHSDPWCISLDPWCSSLDLCCTGHVPHFTSLDLCCTSHYPRCTSLDPCCSINNLICIFNALSAFLGVYQEPEDGAEAHFFWSSHDTMKDYLCYAFCSTHLSHRYSRFKQRHHFFVVFSKTAAVTAISPM